MGIIDIKWAALILGAIVVVLLNRRAKDFIYTYRLNIVSSMKYDETTIMTHLQYIVQQCLDYYHLFKIIASNREVHTITSDLQNEMIEYLTNEVPARISPALRDQLALIYYENNIGNVIGEVIYMTVQNFAIDFNAEMANRPIQDRNRWSRPLETKNLS